MKKRKQTLLQRYVAINNQACRSFEQRQFKKAEREIKRLFPLLRHEDVVQLFWLAGDDAEIRTKQENISYLAGRLFCRLGEVYLAKHRLGRAMWYFKKALTMIPYSTTDTTAGYEFAQSNIAAVYALRGYPDRSMAIQAEIVTSILKKGVRSTWATTLLVRQYAISLVKQGCFDEAITFILIADQLLENWNLRYAPGCSI